MVFLQYEPARFLFDAECARATEISAAMAFSAFSWFFYFRDRKTGCGRRLLARGQTNKWELIPKRGPYV